MDTNEALLQVHDLAVEVGAPNGPDGGARSVLRGLALELRAGQLAVLMGANGSGKSTLALALAGHPGYRVTRGQVRFAGQDLLALDATARARAGLFLSFQTPPDIPGVKTNLFLRSALNAVRSARGEAEIDAYDFLGSARAAARQLGLPDAMLARAVNDGFSGGERKRSELLQLALLQPKLALLDEIDSGLDVDGVRAVVELVTAQRARGMALLVVSHSLPMIEALAPDAVWRLDDGRIDETGGLALARAIARDGYLHASDPVAA